MQRADFEQLPITEYLDDTFETAALEFGPQMDLREGTVLVLYHDIIDRSYIFESLQQSGPKHASGLYTKLEGVQIIEERQEADISLSNPYRILEQGNSRYVEFHFPEQQGIKRRLMPAVTCYEVLYSKELARIARAARIKEDIVKPFEGELERKVIRNLIELYRRGAEKHDDAVSAYRLREVARQLQRDFPDEVSPPTPNPDYL